MSTPARVDLLLRGGDVIDGTGAPGARADVAVSGDRIVAVGALDAVVADRELDVSGRVVCPGFVDVHTHDDRALLEPLLQHPKLSQGVTTVVTGNCGISLAPLHLAGSPGGHRQPPAPLDLLGEAGDFRYASYAAWREAVSAARPLLNAAPLVGHSSLRVGVMRSLERAADDNEIDAMCMLFDEAIEEGCFGLSSGLHYPPASAAPANEVRALVARLAGNGGIYTAHIRDESDDVIDSMHEAFDIAAEAGNVPLVLSHHKLAGRQNFGRSCETLALIDSQRLRQPLGVDVYPYAASSTSLLPEYVNENSRVLVTWSRALPQAGGRELADIAAELGVTRRDAAQRLRPAGAVYFEMDEGDVRRILAHPDVMVGSDGLPHDRHPHPRLWGTFPRVLGHYSRDLGLFPLEQAVYRMTGLPAGRFGLAERGRVTVGNHADLVVFDARQVADRATFAEPTLPAAGIDWVLVNGVPAWHAGAATGERAGRVLTRTSPAAAADDEFPAPWQRPRQHAGRRAARVDTERGGHAAEAGSTMSAAGMPRRPEPLARFIDALRVAVVHAAPAGSEAAAAARRVFSGLETAGTPGETLPGEPPSACEHLAAALANARAGPGSIAKLADAFRRLAPALPWRRRPGSEEHGSTFHDGHANAWVVGPDAHERRSDVVVGVSLLAPRVRYPEHRHPPEEIYLVMSAGDWYQTETGWHAPGIGGVVYHRPGVTHAMRSGDQPLLAVWCLWTGTD